MGQDNQPKVRQQARDLHRRAAVRQAYERILIVCEGEKTEPNYLNEIRHEHRLASAHVAVHHGEFGTEPIRVVDFAEHLVRHGNPERRIEPKTVDRVFVVFDRDEHQSYHQALARTSALNLRLLNDERNGIAFEAVASVPCFELWLLLHFETVQAPVGRDDVHRRLEGHLPGYDKGQGGHWARTKERLEQATQRAIARAAATTVHDGIEAYTDMHRLAQRLVHLKD